MSKATEQPRRSRQYATRFAIAYPPTTVNYGTFPSPRFVTYRKVPTHEEHVSRGESRTLKDRHKSPDTSLTRSQTRTKILNRKNVVATLAIAAVVPTPVAVYADSSRCRACASESPERPTAFATKEYAACVPTTVERRCVSFSVTTGRFQQ